MDRTERFYKIDQMLHDRSVVPLGDFLEEIGISRATFKRDLEYMRDRFHAPIEWDRDAGGYRLVQTDRNAPAYALPGLWFMGNRGRSLDIKRGILLHQFQLALVFTFPSLRDWMSTSGK